MKPKQTSDIIPSSTESASSNTMEQPGSTAELLRTEYTLPTGAPPAYVPACGALLDLFWWTRGCRTQ